MVKTFVNFYICLALLLCASNFSQIKLIKSSSEKSSISELNISQETSPIDISSTNKNHSNHHGFNNGEEEDNEEVEIEDKISHDEKRYLNLYINTFSQNLKSNYKIKSNLLFNIWKPPQNNLS
jgi:hypothetical protein